MISFDDYEDARFAVSLLEAEVRSEIAATEDELELLKAQREIREADLMVAEAEAEKAEAGQANADRLSKQAMVSLGEAQMARFNTNVARAHFQARKAALKEIAVRITQAERRLGRWKAIPLTKPDSAPAPIEPAAAPPAAKPF